MSISRATVDQAVQEIQRNQEQAEKQLKEDQATKAGKDPSRPYHPILNATEEELIERWRTDRQMTTRKKYGSIWRDCIEKIRARTWSTRKEIAKHYGRSNSWAACMVQLMAHQGVFAAEDLRALLPGRHRPKNKRPRRQQHHHQSN